MEKIVLSFLPVGHTKFSCDWAFGLLKKKFRVTHVSSIEELVQTIEQSTPTSKVNTAISVGNEKGDVDINVYDWQGFFTENKCSKVPHITKFNHFEFYSDNKGKVVCKSEIDGIEFIHTIFKSLNGPSGFPEVIKPPGLSEGRKQYLYKNIRPFCKDQYKDILCPFPTTGTEDTCIDEPDEPEATPGPSRPSKRKRSI